MKYYEVFFRIEGAEAFIDDARDVLSALAGDAGFETFEACNDGLKGYVQQALFSQAQLDEVLSVFPFPDVRISYKVSEAEDQDWNQQWEQEGFEPIIMADQYQCVIHDGRHLPENISQYKYSIEIDTHLAFGTGTHETTRMMVATLLEQDIADCRILDCGCGTGILAITALKAGAREAIGYDIDEWSVDNARHNAVINCVEDRFTSLLGDAGILLTIEGTFDIVLANINRNILLADLPAFHSKMKDGGKLLLSGFYQSDIPILTAAAEKEGLAVVSQKQENDWACLLIRTKC